MTEVREVKLEGGLLRVMVAPFAESKALYQAVLSEMKGIPFSSASEMMTLFRDIYCTSFSSPAIEKELWACMARCTYDYGHGNMAIKPESFESVKARADYASVCYEVAKDNIGPFVKNLFALFEQVSAATESYQKSKSPKTI